MKNILKWHNPERHRPTNDKLWLIVKYWEYGQINYKIALYADNKFYAIPLSICDTPLELKISNVVFWAYLPEVKNA